YPAEVEKVLSEHPAIARAAVVGAPDPDLGEIGVAFVVPEPDGEQGALATPTLRAWCKERLTDYKAPNRVVLVDDLPTTPMLKIDKRALLERATAKPNDHQDDKEMP
ncbi:MAG TPA: long-chain fatty acid--CoA ligase, partial [Acidimicrobiia bacterium]|nr:long-chain fatty acid--CoA ligase [Acidimicrobiia bacterium]